MDIKKQLKSALEANDLDTVVSLVLRQRRALSQLIRIAYDKDTLSGWRAIEAIGRAAKVLVESDYGYLRDTIRKLLWSLSDESGGIGWAAPEILGEIVSADPEKFSDIVPLIAEVYEVEEVVFRPGIVYALSRVAGVAPELVSGFQKVIIRSLTDKEPLVKINALELVSRLWKTVRKKKLWQAEYVDRVIYSINSLLNDKGVAWVYRNDNFVDTQVGEKAIEVRQGMV